MKFTEIKSFLDEQVEKFNQRSFIETDPIQMPHRFSKKQDIEIAAFLTSTIAWGNRTAIIKSAENLMSLMENSPHDFILNASANDLHSLEKFYYRTFQPTDILYFIKALKAIYSKNETLEMIFAENIANSDKTVKNGLIAFRKAFTAYQPEKRTLKHLPNVEKKSAAKRLNMFLRWMVRDDGKVDFGIWKRISQKQLICPLDVHSGKTARLLGILTRKGNDWQAAIELTDNLKKFCENDPVKYDFALFGLGALEKFSSR